MRGRAWLLACLVTACQNGGTADPRNDQGASGAIPVAGGELAVTDTKSRLAGARLRLPANVLTAPLAVTIARGTPVLPAGYVALSPPISFGPERTRFAREATVTLPVDFSLVPPHADLSRVDVFRFRPATRDPIAPPFNNLRALRAASTIQFDAEELTTFQAAIRAD